MIDLPFASIDIPAPQQREIAAALSDEAFAAEVMEQGWRAFERGSGSWVPRLILIAAYRLSRHAEFLPDYEQFLNWLDTQPKKDWHSSISNIAPANDLFAQSGLSGIPMGSFEAELKRLLENIGPQEDGTILDVGCGGGLWSLRLAHHGYRVIGIDRHPGIIAAARDNARTLGVEANVQFLVDDACNSRLPASANSARVLCIGVTPCLADDNAFHALIGWLDRVSRVPNPPPYGRMVILSSNRWGLSRMDAVRGILAADPGDYALASHRLFLVELNWWMHLQHLQAIKEKFQGITVIGERRDAMDGIREVFLLR
jgi:SAM-dependent methyltransferase